jgi:PAS domain S-box-containing protein
MSGATKICDQIREEIEERLGCFPALFRPALNHPQALHNLWQQTLASYLKNPLPEAFKEKLLMYLSWVCGVSYEMVSPQPPAEPPSLPEVLRYFREQATFFDSELESLLSAFPASTITLFNWPAPASRHESALLGCTIHIFLQKPDYERCQEALAERLGTKEYACLVQLLSYLRMCEMWVVSQPTAFPRDPNLITEESELMALESPMVTNVWSKRFLGRPPAISAEDRAGSAQLRVQRHIEALLSNTRFADKLIECSASGIYAHDLDLRCVLWNPAMETLTGLGKETVLGKRAPSVLSFLASEEHQRAFLEVLTERKDRFIECVFRHPLQDDERVWECQHSPLIDENGEVIGGFAIVTDVTERRRQRIALSLVEQRCRVIVEAASDVIYTVSPEGIILSLNSAFETTTGWKPEEWIGRHFVDLIYPEDLPLSMGLFAQTLSGVSNRSVELRGITKSGDVRVYDASGVPQVENGKVVSIIGIVRDVTLRKRNDEMREQLLREQLATAEVRASEAHYRQLAEAIPQIVWTAEPDGKVDYGNSRWSEYTGITRGTGLGEGWILVVHPDDRLPSARTFEVARLEGKTFETKYRLKNGNGVYRWFLVRAWPLKDDTGRIIKWFGTSTDIDDQEKAQRALQSSEERFRLLVDGLRGYVIFMLDSDGKVASWNAGAERVKGYRQAEILGRDFSVFYPPEEGREIPARHLASAAETGTFEFEGWRITKDGSRYLGQTEIRALFDPDKTLRGYSVVIHDITNQREVEEKLKRSETRFHLISRATNDCIWDWDLKRNIVDRSSAFEDYLGYSPGENNEKITWWYDCVHPEDRDRVIASVQEAMTSGAPYWRAEYRYRKKDGAYAIVVDRGFVVVDEAGKPARILGAMSDVTERRRVQEQLRRFKFLTDNANDAYFLIGESGKFVYVNQTACALLGYTEDELLQLGSSDIDPQSPAGKTFDQRFRCIESKPTKSRETVLRHKGGTGSSQVEVTSSAVQFEGNRYISMVAREITDRKRTEEELRRKTETLAQSNADLQQFAYVASHDLKEPLRMVHSYLQLLQKRYSDCLNEEAREFMGFASEGASRMYSLIDGLLAYSRVGANSEPASYIDSKLALTSALANLEPRLQETNGKVTFGKLPVVQFDMIQLIQLFQNLIGNALKFRSRATPEILVRAERGEGEWIFSIQDNGLGIEREYNDRIFALFQRLHTREKYPGTGIGLAICRKILERHGGRIWVESLPNAGSTFHFTILDASGSLSA